MEKELSPIEALVKVCISNKRANRTLKRFANALTQKRDECVNKDELARITNTGVCTIRLYTSKHGMPYQRKPYGVDDIYVISDIIAWVKDVEDKLDESNTNRVSTISLAEVCGVSRQAMFKTLLSLGIPTIFGTEKSSTTYIEYRHVQAVLSFYFV